MRRLRIQCVNKVEKGPFKGSINRIGGLNENGERWNISIEEAQKGIDSGLWEFYIKQEKLEENITFSSDEEPVLENLMECPW
ncbi:hypothetical protein [Echinicola shivajiensis]|uniref:hypothetical protein n=1 Tax=Echinicola shivajiensis TaxID=1035916 RepID=UPI001BFC76E5|nr:hypothetical protein [Echinicola shivajiensis]